MTCREVVDAFETMAEDGMFSMERFQLHTVCNTIFVTFYPTDDHTDEPVIDYAVIGKDGWTDKWEVGGCIITDDLPKWDGRTVRTLAHKVKDSEYALSTNEADLHLIGARHVVSLVLKLLSIDNS